MKKTTMGIPMTRYARNKYLNDPQSPVLYYLRQASGSFKVMGIDEVANEIEERGGLTSEDITYSVKAFTRQLRKSLRRGDKVKVDGLGTFYLSYNSEGSEEEKDCTVRNIKRVNIRFKVDKDLRMVNDTTAVTRGENNVLFYIASGKTETDTPDNPGGDDDDPTA